MKSHRELYPEQYTHPLVGARVQVAIGGELRAEGVCSRVVESRYGALAVLDDDATNAWRVADCQRLRRPA